MRRYRFQFRETCATVLAEERRHFEAAAEGMMEARQELERCIASDPFFAATFAPCQAKGGGKTVQRMVEAGFQANVGPMAAVAGAIAWAGAEAMIDAGAERGVIDNGGDIALFSDQEVTIGLHAGESPLSGTIAFVIPPVEGISAVCTSSATVGHSTSFGIADSVTVFGRNPAEADAWATAICNELKPGETSVLDRLRERSGAASGVRGVFAVFGDQVVTWGEIPRIVPARVDPSLITRAA